ncbi:sodium:solute symporter family protein, partial [bacterium]|nr:sodium:solute symporter family protein [bacterium]
MFLGLHVTIWVVLVLYLGFMLLLGWWSKRQIHDREGFLLGNRRFGIWYMMMHAFGAGTNPSDVGGVSRETIRGGASGIWISWMWMFGTPFYWIIAPVVRRMRCLTLADYFEERFGKAASVLYVLTATIGMTVFLASMLLATTRTVQGMMNKHHVESAAVTTPAAAAPATTAPADVDALAVPAPAAEAQGVSKAEAEQWFFGILFIMAAVFGVYSFWGGIVAAIKTDMLQGLMIIALSVIAIPKALALVGGFGAAKATLAASSGSFLLLFDPQSFSLATVLVLCINAPFAMMSQPHLMSVCAAGKTEWEGRVGFAYGNILKRLCTMGWCILMLCWLAHLIRQGVVINTSVAEASFGSAVRGLLPHILQGVMLACVMAAAMSTGDALQVTIAGLISQNIYRTHLRPDASEAQCVRVTRWTGIAILAASLGFAVLMRGNFVKAILQYMNIMGAMGVAVVMGILWRRMNSTGVFTATLAGVLLIIGTRYVVDWPADGLRDTGAITITSVPPDQANALREEGKVVATHTVTATTMDGKKIRAVHHELVEWQEPGALRTLHRAGLVQWSGNDLESLTLKFTLMAKILLPLLGGILAGIL